MDLYTQLILTKARHVTFLKCINDNPTIDVAIKRFYHVHIHGQDTDCIKMERYVSSIN